MAIYCEKHRTRGMCLDCAKEKREASAVASNDGVIKPDLIERYKKEIWIVAHQMPRARIVGLFKSYIDASAKYNKVPDKNCPLIYQCPPYMVKSQAGYNRRLKLR
jgi:hypothetical protein